MTKRFLRHSLALSLCLAPLVLTAAEPAVNNTAVEALSRLQGIELETNPRMKAAVLKVLATTRGTPQFVQIVKQFHLKEQEEGLLEVALGGPATEAGVEAMRQVLAGGQLERVKKLLKSTNIIQSTRTVEALGNTGEKQALPLLLPLVTAEERDLALRKQAVRALVRTSEGAGDLLKLVREEKLSENLKFVASSELNGVRWPAIQAEAAQLLPLPAAQNAPLPPLAELLKMKGDRARGAEVFSRDTTGCAKCHQVAGKGVDIGPALSEIGSKLGKDALVEAILDPSAGISFGFEAHQVELKSGDEAYGLVVSDTAEELAVKDLKGIVTRYKKIDVKSNQTLKNSLMPTGLQASMSPQELVDLLEYLSSLKKAGN